MSDIRVVELEAATLEEAQRSARAEVGAGEFVVSEVIVARGERITVPGTGHTEEAAAVEALEAVPEGAEILSEKVMAEPPFSLREIAAKDHPDAKAQAVATCPSDHLVVDVTLTSEGRKGFLGIGRKKAQYSIKRRARAMVEVEYQLPARIRIEIGQLLSKADVLDAVGALLVKTIEQYARLDRPVQGQLAAVMVMDGAFNFLKDQVSTPFNRLLANAREVSAENDDGLGIRNLSLGPPETFDVHDIHLVGEQFKKAIGAIQELQAALKTS